MVILVCITALVAALATHELAQKKSWGTIRASSFLTLLFVGFMTLLKIESAFQYEMVFLGGSFVGMTDPKRLNRIQITFASQIFSILFLNLISFLGGLGGVLGLSAFLSCLLINSIFHSGAKMKTILKKNVRKNPN